MPKSLYHTYDEPKASSFTAEPPTITIRGESIKLRAFNSGWQHLVTAIAARVEKPEMLCSALVSGFAAIYSLPPADAYAILKDGERLDQEVMKADMELTPEDIAAVDEYIAGVMKRSQEAAITADERAGKSPATATRRPKKLKPSTSSRVATGGRGKKS